MCSLYLVRNARCRIPVYNGRFLVNKCRMVNKCEGTIVDACKPLLFVDNHKIDDDNSYKVIKVPKLNLKLPSLLNCDPVQVI